MKTCGDCGKVYADKFDSCPNCKSKKVGKGCLLVVALFLGVAVIASIFSSDDKSDSVTSSSQSTTSQASKEDLNQCVNREVRTGRYDSFDGGKSAMAIMAACSEPLKKKMPVCFADDPKDNEVDNKKQMSPGANCRVAAVMAIQLTLKAYEGGIPLSDEAAPGAKKQDGAASRQDNRAASGQTSDESSQEPTAPNDTTGSDQGTDKTDAHPVVTDTAPTTASEGPSFDCSRVTSEVLKLVCRNPALSRADRELAGAYRSARARTSESDYLVRTQRQWIQDRTNSPAEVPYLLRMYRDRIDYLNAL